MHLSAFKLSQSRCRLPMAGFSLVEVVVAVALLGLIGSITANVYGVITRSTTSTSTAANTLAAIDSDISRIKQISETLTCCPGSCTTNATTIATAVANSKCGGSTPGLSSYYWPLVSGDVTTFEAACNATLANGAIETAMLSAINGLTQPTGATRTASVDEIAAHRILVTYTGTTGTGGSFVNRDIKIVPTVASFCP